MKKKGDRDKTCIWGRKKKDLKHIYRAKGINTILKPKCCSDVVL